jgi:hypothetical protein
MYFILKSKRINLYIKNVKIIESLKKENLTKEILTKKEKFFNGKNKNEYKTNNDFWI